jgi:inhibitor of cysteine peptidase
MMLHPATHRGLVAVIATALMLSFSGCGGDTTATTIIGEEDMNTEIDMDAGDLAEIRLPSNPSTGFRWVIPTDLTEVPVLIVDDWHEEAETDLVGAPGTDVFRIEATTRGAGILRLEYRQPFDTSTPPERVAEFIIRVDDAPWPPENPDRPDTTSVAAPEPDDTIPPSDQDSMTVTELIEGGAQDTATVQGFLFSDATSWRLCENLMESYPAQCGGPAIVIDNPDDIDPGLRESMDENQGIAWTASPVTVTATYDGDRLIMTAPVDGLEPTDTDRALIDDFLAFVVSNDADTLAPIPFAPEVVLGLGPDPVATVPSTDLVDPSRWRLDVAEFDGYAGPFSALDIGQFPGSLDDVTLTIGAHRRCVAPPTPAPTGITETRRVSVQPADATSCLEWWSVDFFLGPEGDVQAITLDLYGP